MTQANDDLNDQRATNMTGKHMHVAPLPKWTSLRTTAVKTTVFIGCAAEDLTLARAIQENLERDFETKVWDQDVFGLSKYPLDVLREQLQAADFGVFVVGHTDSAIIRHRQYGVPRDNVIFEIGLFQGALGRERTFVVLPRGVGKLHLPTDWQGLTLGEYESNRSDDNLVAAMAPVCNKIRKRIHEEWTSVAARRTGLVDARLFGELASHFTALLGASTECTLYFIHSRRWRENYNEELRAFLGRQSTKLNVYLPDLANDRLLRMLQEHFEDGPHIPGFIADAYRYFRMLSEDVGDRVRIRVFGRYPTYSFYTFDRTTLVALYPATTIKKDVPAFLIDGGGSFQEFLDRDRTQLRRESRAIDARALRTLERRYGTAT